VTHFPQVMLQSDDVEELTASLITAPTSNASTEPSERLCPRDPKPRHRCRVRHKDDNSQTDYVLPRTAGPNYKATAPEDGFCVHLSEAMFNSSFVHKFSPCLCFIFHRTFFYLIFLLVPLRSKKKKALGVPGVGHGWLGAKRLG
jgi:hypothetical protein